MLSSNPSTAKVTYQDVCRSAAGPYISQAQDDLWLDCLHDKPLYCRDCPQKLSTPLPAAGYWLCLGTAALLSH